MGRGGAPKSPTLSARMCSPVSIPAITPDYETGQRSRGYGNRLSRVAPKSPSLSAKRAEMGRGGAPKSPTLSARLRSQDPVPPISGGSLRERSPYDRSMQEKSPFRRKSSMGAPKSPSLSALRFEMGRGGAPKSPTLSARLGCDEPEVPPISGGSFHDSDYSTGRGHSPFCMIRTSSATRFSNTSRKASFAKGDTEAEARRTSFQTYGHGLVQGVPPPREDGICSTHVMESTVVDRHSFLEAAMQAHDIYAPVSSLRLALKAMAKVASNSSIDALWMLLERQRSADGYVAVALQDGTIHGVVCFAGERPCFWDGDGFRLRLREGNVRR